MPVLAIILLFGIILDSFLSNIIEKSLNIIFVPKSDFQKQNKRLLPGCLQTVVWSGDAPKPPFPIKTDKKLEKPGNQDPINHRYSLSLYTCVQRDLGIRLWKLGRHVPEVRGLLW